MWHDAPNGYCQCGAALERVIVAQGVDGHGDVWTQYGKVCPERRWWNFWKHFKSKGYR